MPSASTGRAAASVEVSAEASATSSSLDRTAKHSCNASSSWPLSPSSFSAEALAAARRASAASASAGGQLVRASRASSRAHDAITSLYCTFCSPALTSNGATMTANFFTSSFFKLSPLQAMLVMKLAAFSRVLGSSAGSRSAANSATPPSDLRRVVSCATNDLTSAMRVRKAFDLSSDAFSASRVNFKKMPMAPLLMPASCMFGLLENSSAKISNPRILTDPSTLTTMSRSACRPSSFSTLRATSGSSQSLSMTSKAVAMLSFVLSSDLICAIASINTLFGSSTFPKASSIACSKNFLSSSDIFVNFEGAVPSWYLVLQANKPGQLSAIAESLCLRERANGKSGDKA
mmetsp:Transcript_75934/g.246430  ORF Transcript_75934/g.246430 Transcript_75934/m.246430 type:complete len:347 (-) Transcript_75934:24-1064(-)